MPQEGGQASDTWWHVGDLFHFENMGFTRPVAPDDETEDASAAPDTAEAASRTGRRYLCCAGCDVGPLGFSARLHGTWGYFVDGARVQATVSPLL